MLDVLIMCGLFFALLEVLFRYHDHMVDQDKKNEKN